MLEQVLSSLQSIANKAEWSEHFDNYVAQVAHDDLLDYPTEYFDTHSAVLNALLHARQFVREIAYDDEMIYTLLRMYTKASNSEAYKEIENMYEAFCEMNSEQ